MITELIDMLTGTKFLDRIGNWFYSIISYRRLALNSINISNPIMEKVVILRSSGFVPNTTITFALFKAANMYGSYSAPSLSSRVMREKNTLKPSFVS